MEAVKIAKLLFMMIPLVFISCSDEHENSSQEVPRLVKKYDQLRYTNNQLSDRYTIEFTYQNNILTSFTDWNNDSRTELEYSGNKIIRATSFSKGVPYFHTDFFYDGNLLQYTLSDGEYPEKKEYFYTNGLLSSCKIGDYYNGQYELQEITNYTFSNGNITETRETYGTPPAQQIKRTYVSDGGNNPAKYMNPYFRLQYLDDGFNGMSANNYMQQMFYVPGYPAPDQITYETTYDGNFPIDIKKRNSFGLISDTFITYN